MLHALITAGFPVVFMQSGNQLDLGFSSVTDAAAQRLWPDFFWLLF
jgi:hypothetical protein